MNRLPVEPKATVLLMLSLPGELPGLMLPLLVTAPVMIKESLKVNLPKTLTSDITSKADSIGVAITKDGQVLFNGKLLSPENLQLELKAISKKAPETNFLISADVDTRHGDVVHMIDLLKRNNLNRFALQVEKIKEGN